MARTYIVIASEQSLLSSRSVFLQDEWRLEVLNKLSTDVLCITQLLPMQHIIILDIDFTLHRRGAEPVR